MGDKNIYILVTTAMILFLFLFAIFYPTPTEEDPEIGTFLVGEFDDNLVDDQFASIFLLYDGSKISVDTVYGIGYENYHVHVHKDPKDAITIIKNTDIDKIYYIKKEREDHD